MYFTNEYTEQHAQRDMHDCERSSNARDAQDLAEFHAGDSPALNAFLDETTPDAPGGRYVMESESEMEQARRRAPRTDWAEYFAVLKAGEAKRWAPIDETTAGPVVAMPERSTLQTLRARFGKKVA